MELPEPAPNSGSVTEPVSYYQLITDKTTVDKQQKIATMTIIIMQKYSSFTQ